MSAATNQETPSEQSGHLDSPPPGWFVLDVVRQGSLRVHWVALMVDVDPDELKYCACEFPALFYVHPKDYRPRHCTAHQAWVRIPGKHKNRDLAWEALQEMMLARH